MVDLDEYKRKLLPTDEDEGTLGSRESRTKRARGIVFKSLIVTVVILVFSITLYVVLVSKWARSISTCETKTSKGEATATNESGVLTCGSTREEALSKGCIFDVLSVGWVPAACYDRQRSAKFENVSIIVSYGSAGAFKWYLDSEMTVPIAESDLSTLGDSPVAYTTEEFHQSHCLYVWKSTSDALHEARTQHTGVWALDRIRDHHHIRHCLIVLESMPWRYNKSVEVDFGYRECVRLDIQ
ncbi:hypothetical protein M409DRAFT_52178 [Zasmidium cellare ATCC 36951]|uniref:Uncharacterized protein n=1 Tax=Zasmidium cellare ATCC 36951 TaxID=1080233 RepID=A0A6A6CRF2_ZASCE|nr:uncharacterized protein M409DRAFT_52178 [Zasmidium cellare ATCC 36951]KAF2169661.1 hypothetical protein M409DRAFT_52178 [Zasmidium cellare ATCC 36951]